MTSALNKWIQYRCAFAKRVDGNLQPFLSANLRAGWNDMSEKLRQRWASAHELDPDGFHELVQHTLAAMHPRPRAILAAIRISFQPADDDIVPPAYMIAEAAREIQAEQDKIQEKREKRKQENDDRKALSRQKAASTRRGKRAGKGKGKGKQQFEVETEAAGVDGEPSAKRQRRGDLARSNALPGPSQPPRYEFSFAQPGPGVPASFSSYARQASTSGVPQFPFAAAGLNGQMEPPFSTAMSSSWGRNEALPPMVPSPWALDAQLPASGAPPPLPQLSQQEIDAMNAIPVFSPDFDIPGFDPLGWPIPFDSVPAVGQSLQDTSQWAAPPASVSHVPGEATQWGNVDLAHSEIFSRSPAAAPGLPYAAEPDILQSFDWQSYNMFPLPVEDSAVAPNAPHDPAQIGFQLNEPAPGRQFADTPDSSNSVTPDRSPSAIYTGLQDPLVMPPAEQAADPHSLGPMPQQLATMYLGGEEDGARFDIENNQYLPWEFPQDPAFDMSQGDEGWEAICGWLPGY
ncbi:hypothetical protein C8Q74DRAFT_406774 [Fomes fomentarius]|nr:hypothetical protein C8Q74DRAFT_406774 [Fomes fomentarius]